MYFNDRSLENENTVELYHGASFSCRLPKAIGNVQYTRNYGAKELHVLLQAFRKSTRAPEHKPQFWNHGRLVFQHTSETSSKERKQWSSSGCIHIREWSSCISGAEERVDLLVLVSQFEIRAWGVGVGARCLTQLGTG
jgi:hypothetical protein